MKYVTSSTIDLLDQLKEETSINDIDYFPINTYLFIEDGNISHNDTHYAGDGELVSQQIFLNHAKEYYPKENKPIKIILPKYIDDVIKQCNKYNATKLGIVSDIYHGYVNDCFNETVLSWLNNTDNRNLIVDAIVNGYDVEEPKFAIQLNVDGKIRYIAIDLLYDDIYIGSDSIDWEFTKKHFTQTEIDELIKFVPVDELK